MARITIYLDDATSEKLKSVAGSAGLSISSYVGDLIRNKIALEWPASVAKLAGSWKDFPSLDEIRQGHPEEAPRESL